MVKIRSFLLMLTFILACCDFTPTDYRITIDRSTRGGGLFQLSGSELHQLAIVEEKNLVVLFSLESCESWLFAKEQLTAYGKLKKCDMFYVDFSEIGESEYNILYETTNYINDAYALPVYGEEIFLPKCYIFSKQAIIVTFSNDYVEKLDTYIKISE